jgi:hypothetical protein
MMREPGDSPPPRATASSSSADENNNTGNDDDNNITPPSVLRSLFIASFLLSLLTLIDIYYTTFLLNTNNNDNNNNNKSWAPLKQMAEIFIPQIILRYFPSKHGNHVYMDEMDVAIDGKICPPDGFLDDGLSQLHHHDEVIRSEEKNSGIHFSSEYDPRNKVLRPSLFPHCELKKWVEQQYHYHQNNQKEQEKQHECSNGEEYITHIYPNNLQQHQQSSSSSNTNNVKILHIAANNNCLPKGTIQSLQSFTNHYYTKNKTIRIAIYIHTTNSIDAILHQHIWTVFPEVTEGLLCGVGKVQFVVDKVLDVLLVKPSAAAAAAATAAFFTAATTDDDQQKKKKRKKEVIANEISYLIKRDIWRYLILWEFGGTVIDLDVLQSIIESSEDNNNGNLIKVAQDWFFGGGSGSSNDDGDAFVTMMNDEGGHNRAAVTSVMGASRPHHPLLYFAAKKALRAMISDNYLAWGEAPEFVSVLQALCLFVDAAVTKITLLSNLVVFLFINHPFFSPLLREHSIPWVAIQTWQHYMQVWSTILAEIG